jgi:hypothetical protein
MTEVWEIAFFYHFCFMGVWSQRNIE